MKRLAAIIVSIVLGLSSFVVYAGHFKTHKVTVPLVFDYYYSYDMAVEALQKLHKAYPKLTRLDMVGKSEEGRGIYCMTVNNPKTGKALDKPGVYVDGNIHGNEVQAAEVGLYLLNYLLTKYGDNAEITKIVDRNCFYVVPMVNVDGRYHFLEGDRPGGNRGLRRPHDDDHDGLLDEDFAEDLDGDGNICRMRKRDPHGNYKNDPLDPRIMVRVKPGEKGEWIMLGREGIDNDGDGRLNEDSEGYVDPNRNWGFDWMPSYVQTGSGDYPFSGVGLKALARYIRQRPNICMSWAFHNSGGMFLRGPSTKTQDEYHPKDIAVYDYLGKQAERITPGYRYLISWKDLYTTYGDFGGWMAMSNGTYNFVGELYMRRTETFLSIEEAALQKQKPARGGNFRRGRNPGQERERLKFNDHVVQGELFKPWKPFKHPMYGDIEIGGWVKMSGRLPAPFMLKDLVHRNAMAVIFSAKNTPDVAVNVFETRKIGEDLYRIRVRLVNEGAIPSMSYHARQVKLYPKDMLTVSGKGMKVVAGGVIKDIHKGVVTYKEYRPRLQFLAVPGFGKVEYQFLVSGSGTVRLKYNSRHAGKIVKTVSLK
ncbi:MAG: hypothetical protein GY950_29050 [bacterium]|nr:hypothetical protein [bacterium]